MIGWLIYNRNDAAKNRPYIDWFIQEALLQNIQLKLIYRESLNIGIINNQKSILYEGQHMELPTFAIVRIMEPTLNMHLEACGIHVFNNKYISLIANNKIRTHDVIHSLDIPMVDTLYIKNNAIPHYPPFSFPFILKDANSRGGKHVFLLHNQADWEHKCLHMDGTDFLIQRCNVQLGIDIRVFVVGREIVGAVKRLNKKDFRANYTLGGTVTWYSLKKEERLMVEHITAHFDFGMVGIDFLLNENGEMLFNEIEDIVGSRSLSNVSNINILRKYVAFIKYKITNQHSI